ncbi:hypothetical protein [Actinomyces vulturis]|nr:hypothetical protein [Actinomyces vulturis]
MQSYFERIIQQYTKFYEDEFALNVAFKGAAIAWNVTIYMNLLLMWVFA